MEISEDWQNASKTGFVGLVMAILGAITAVAGAVTSYYQYKLEKMKKEARDAEDEDEAWLETIQFEDQGGVVLADDKDGNGVPDSMEGNMLIVSSNFAQKVGGAAGLIGAGMINIEKIEITLGGKRNQPVIGVEVKDGSSYARASFRFLSPYI